jgi:hypothetical protein
VKDGTNVVTATIDLVNDVDDSGGTVKQNRAAMPRRRVDPEAAVMLGGPVGNITVIDELGLQCVCVTVRPPRRITEVAVRPRAGEDFHSAVADLNRERGGVRLQRNAEGPVRSTVAAAPDFWEMIVASSTERG